jgi:hypothetical protein
LTLPTAKRSIDIQRTEVLPRLDSQSKQNVFERLHLLLNWFTDARIRPQQTPHSLPATDPVVIWLRDKPVVDDATGESKLETGWFDPKGKQYCESLVWGLLRRGYETELRANKKLSIRWPSVNNFVGERGIPDSLVREGIESEFWRHKLISEPGFVNESVISQAGGEFGLGRAQKDGDTRSGVRRTAKALEIGLEPRWSWQVDEPVASPHRAERSPIGVERNTAILDELIARLLQPQGQEVGARLARLSLRLDAAKPPMEVTDNTQAEWAQRNCENGEDPNRPIVITGDPEPWRATGRQLSLAERETLFGESDPAPGSASHPDFYLPFGSVIVIPQDEPAYIRGRGWSVTRTRHLQTWDWTIDKSRVLPIGGVDSKPAENDGRINRSPVPLHGGVCYRGLKYWNRDGSGVLYDETLYEHEDRRARIRQQMWTLMRDKRDHYGFATWRRPPGWSMLGRPPPAMTTSDDDTSEAHGWAPGVPPDLWWFYYWTMVGGYMTEDDWTLGAGLWRWPQGLGPRRRMPVRDTLAYRAGPDTWPGKWNKPDFNRQWLRSILPDRLGNNLAISSLRGCESSVNHDGRVGNEPFLAAWADELLLHMKTIDTPKKDETLVNGQTQWRRSFEKLKGDAFGGSMEAYLAAAEGKMEFDRRQHEAMTTELSSHRAWMEANCTIAYIPNPEGNGPLDGPDAQIIKQPWRWDFAPEPLIAPEAFRIPALQHNGAYDFPIAEGDDANQSRAQGIYIAPGETGPDDGLTVRQRDADLQHISLEELDAQQRRLIAKAEAILFGSIGAEIADSESES